MAPPHTRSDPKGYYTRLGLNASATQAEIVAAFRAKARMLHPDVARTGNAEAFVALKQAYDQLSNRQQRESYDRRAREASFEAVGPEITFVRRPATRTADALDRPRGFFSFTVLLRVGLGGFLCLGVYQVTTHLLTSRSVTSAGIRPNAAIVAPLPPGAHQAVLYGPTPVHLAGIPNFYVTPTAGPATLWFRDARRAAYVPLGQLPPFSSVQAIRLIRDSGMAEVLLNDRGNGFITADHLTPGSAAAARQAYCSYNAGTTPVDGELLETHGHGSGTLQVENRAVQPAVVKLRDNNGSVALSVFLGPGSRVEYHGLPDGAFHADFAVGELWSRACNSFAVGARSRRMDAALRLPEDKYLVVAPDAGLPASSDISAQAFEQD